jgi:hypothetical protein
MPGVQGPIGPRGERGPAGGPQVYKEQED